MHLSNGTQRSRAVWPTMKHQIGTFHSPHRLYWHPICTSTGSNEEFWPSVLQVYTSMDSQRKPNTEEPGAAKTHRKLNEALQTARESQANSCFKATSWRTFRISTLCSTDRLPFGNEAPVWGERDQNMPQKIKKIKKNKTPNSSSILNPYRRRH